MALLSRSTLLSMSMVLGESTAGVSPGVRRETGDRKLLWGLLLSPVVVTADVSRGIGQATLGHDPVRG